MESEAAAALPSIDQISDDPPMYEYNDIGLALRLNSLREPESA